MAIIGSTSNSVLVGAPFCDYLNVSFPFESSGLLLSELEAFFPSVGPYQSSEDGTTRFISPLTLKVTGTIKARRRAKVLIVSASGGVLRDMRDKGVFGEYLAILASYPHRVTMLHATADYAVDSPPQVISEVKAAAFAGDISLTRKRVQPGNCKAFTGQDSDGLETGTIYLGQRANADVWAKVYDKRYQQQSLGFADPGPIVRVEVAVQSDVGATLRDAYEPTAIYFHFAGRSLVSTPPDAPEWIAHGEGFTLPKSAALEASEKVSRLVESSYDLGRLIELAIEAYGERAADELCREIRGRVRRASNPLSHVS
jgi:hypothetical protein